MQGEGGTVLNPWDSGTWHAGRLPGSKDPVRLSAQLQKQIKRGLVTGWATQSEGSSGHPAADLNPLPPFF